MQMIQYIAGLAADVVKAGASKDGGIFFQLLPALAEELNRLDPRDFVAGAQYEFVRARVSARHWDQRSINGTDHPKIGAMAQRVINVLGKYGGDSSRIASRTFPFVKDRDLRTIVERD
jgi:hypothetical protein